MDLKALLDELKERRWRVAHYVGGSHHSEALAELATLQTAIQAVEAVIEEDRGEPPAESSFIDIMIV